MPSDRDLQRSFQPSPFRTGRVVGETLLAAACGWALNSIVLFVWLGIGEWRAHRGYPYSRQLLQDQLSMLVLWAVATAIVTALATLVCIVPYVLLRSPALLLRRPWRMYLEPCLLAVLVAGGLAFLIRPTADSGWQAFLLAAGFSIVAAMISLASSFVLLKRLRRLTSLP